MTTPIHRAITVLCLLISLMNCSYGFSTEPARTADSLRKVLFRTDDAKNRSGCTLPFHGCMKMNSPIRRFAISARPVRWPGNLMIHR